jgi:2-oxoglutarate dehydrogenase complex dehydrogenase (E1) component-like enzyme
MFSNEFEFGETVTTVLDETAEYEDVELHITEEMVYLRQFNPKTKMFEVIMMTPKMYYDLLESRNHTEGLFMTKLRPLRQ